MNFVFLFDSILNLTGKILDFIIESQYILIILLFEIESLALEFFVIMFKTFSLSDPVVIGFLESVVTR
jgi:hypothetical protein